MSQLAERDRQGEGRGPGRADRLPAGRLPRRRRPRSTAMTAAVEAGADVVEIGVPYSDPGMDGPVIQQAVDVAVRAGVGMRDVLRAVEAVAAAGAVPVVMSYWNPIERYGVERFATDLAAAGGAGAITPDLIPDEAAEWIAAAERGRPRPGLPRRAVVHRRAAALDDRGLPRLRLRRLDDGRHRHPADGQRRRREAGRPHPGGRARPGGLRRASASPTARRPPRSPPSPTASSSARPTCASCSRAAAADGVRALTADLGPRECGHDRPRRPSRARPRASGSSGRCRSAPTRCASSPASSRAVLITEKRWVARGGAPGDVLDIAVWAVPFGIIGGRLYHVITSPRAVLRRGRRPAAGLRHLGGRPRHLGRHRPRRGRRLDRLPAPRHPAAGLRRRPRARACWSPRRSAGWATGSTTSSTAARPTCRGR